MTTKSNDDHTVINRFMTDDEFRKNVLKDPASALSAEGYSVSPDLQDKLQNADSAAVEQAVGDAKSGKNQTC